MKWLCKMKNILLGAFAAVLALACVSLLPTQQKTTAKADTATHVMLQDVTVIKDNPAAGYDTVVLIFSGDVATEYAVQSHNDGNYDKFPDSVYDYIKINGMTIRERIAAYAWANDTLYWGPSNGTKNELNKMLMYVNRNEAAQTAGTALKWDGTDTFEVLAGFTGTNGATTVSDARKAKYTQNGIDRYVDEPNASTARGTNVAVKSIAINVNQDGENDWINLDFDGAITANGNNHVISSYIYDYIKVNGKTLGEHRKAYGDVVSNADNAFGVEWYPYSMNNRILIRLKTVAMGNVYGLKNDGTDVIEVLKGFVGQNGNKTIGNVRMKKYTQNGLNVWMDTPVESGETVNVTSVEVYPNANPNYYMLYVLFDGDLTAYAQNNVISASVYDKISLNGKTIGAINAATPNTVSVLWNPGYSTKLLIYVKKSATDGIAVNQDCVLAIDEGFVAQNGAATTAAYEYYFQHYQKNGADKILLGAKLTGETITVTGASVYPKQDAENDWVFFIFDGVVSETNLRSQNASVYDYIKINGKTLSEHRQAFGQAGYSADNAFGVEWNVVGANTKILLRLKTVEAGNVYGLNLDGKDRLEILSGFVTLTGKTTAEDYDVIFGGGKYVATDTLVNNYALTSSGETDTSVLLTAEFALGVQENEAAADIGKLAFNGVTFDQVADGKATAVWKNTDGKVSVFFTLDKSLLNTDGKNTLVIGQGFAISSHLALTEDIALVYNPDYVYWAKDSNFEFPAEALAVESVGAPRLLQNGSFVVTVAFNKTVTETRLQNFTASFDTLLSESEKMTPGYYYTSQIIDNIVLADIPHSALHNLKVNGVALSEIYAENVGYVEVSMYGNEMMILISADSTHKVESVQSNITVEVNAGVRSYRGGETSEDVLYTYDYENGAWVVGELPNNQGGEGGGDGSVDYGCKGSMAGGAGVIALAALAVVLKKKKEN